jgi:hypothetical protein
VTVKYTYDSEFDTLTLWSEELIPDTQMILKSLRTISKHLVTAYLHPEKDIVVHIVIDDFIAKLADWPDHFHSVRFKAYDLHNGINGDLEREIYDAKTGWRYLYGKLEDRVRDTERRLDAFVENKH